MGTAARVSSIAAQENQFMMKIRVKQTCGYFDVSRVFTCGCASSVSIWISVYTQRQEANLIVLY